jgi:hypothetical protein
MPPVPIAQQLLPLLVHPLVVTEKFCMHEQFAPEHPLVPEGALAVRV